MDKQYNLIIEFTNFLKQNGKEPATVNSYASDIRELAAYLCTYKVTLEQAEVDSIFAFQAHLWHTCKDSTNSIRRKIISIRQFYKFIYETKKKLSSPFNSLIIPARDETLPTQLQLTDIDNLFLSIKAESNPLKRSRDGALVSLLCFEGLKAHEIINLMWHDLLIIKNKTSLRIKGSRKRVLTLLHRTSKLLKDYKKQKKAFNLKVQSNNNMFVSFKGKGFANIQPRLTRHGLKFLLYEHSELEGTPLINTEKLRHFAIRHHLMLGKPPEAVMTHLGLKRLGNITKHICHTTN